MEGADLSRDEKLAIEIEKYPVIYDKGHPEHKRIDIQENAWKMVAEAMSSTTDDVKRLFRNLKTKYGKKRSKMADLNRSGTSRKKVKAAMKAMDSICRFLVG